jgi:hypothetical protein
MISIKGMVEYHERSIPIVMTGVWTRGETVSSGGDMNDWRVEMRGKGRAGSIDYFENGHVASFSWELGGSDVVFFITGPPPQEWAARLAWAIDRREEVLSRIAEEVIRMHAPRCSFEVTDGGVSAVIRRVETEYGPR